MNADEVLRIVEQIHLERKIDKEIVFVGIEQALVIAARKQTDESTVRVHIDRQSGEIAAYRDNIRLSPEEIAERIGAQTAKQVMIQKIREAERDAVYDEYIGQIGRIFTGEVHKIEGSTTLITLPNVDAILPQSEKIQTSHKGEGNGNFRESFRIGTSVQALLIEVRKAGTKVKVVLSRNRPLFVQRLFEQEIPEVADGTIVIKGISREAGNRSKVAVWCSDDKIDPVGACIGMRNSRIRSIVDELGGERIDVVAWDEDLINFIPRALQPAIVDEVILCTKLGRAIVLVQREQRSLAIGKRGQNVRLASKLCGWDIEIMTRDELENLLAKATDDFNAIPEISSELADRLVGEGFFSYDDLSIIEIEDLMEFGDITREAAEDIVNKAEEIIDENEAQERSIAEEEQKNRRVEPEQRPRNEEKKPRKEEKPNSSASKREAAKREEAAKRKISIVGRPEKAAPDTTEDLKTAGNSAAKEISSQEKPQELEKSLDQDNSLAVSDPSVSVSDAENVQNTDNDSNVNISEEVSSEKEESQEI